MIALGRRVEKNVGGTITWYYYARQQIVEEHDAADAVQAFYTYGTYIDEPLTMDRPSGTRYYYHANRLYSTYLLTDSMGGIAERYSYTALWRPPPRIRFILHHAAIHLPCRQSLPFQRTGTRRRNAPLQLPR